MDAIGRRGLCARAVGRLRAGGSLGSLGATILRRSARAASRPGARRLSRLADHRWRAAMGAQLGSIASHASGTSVPGARLAVYLPRADAGAHLGRARSRDAAAHRHQAVHQHLRTDAHYLDGRPAPSARVGRAHVGGILNGPLRRRHAYRHDDPHQAGITSSATAPISRTSPS